MKKPLKTSIVTFRVTLEMRELIDAAAAKEHRTLASLIEKAVSDWLNHNGYQLKQMGTGNAPKNADL